MYVMSRVKGPTGLVRELQAIVDPNAEFCSMFARDGHDLGYGEAVIRPKQWQKLHPDRAPYVLDFRGIERSVLFALKEVSVGDIVVKDVDTVIVDMDIPRLVPFDMILGKTFLKHCKFTVDIPNGYFELASK